MFKNLKMAVASAVVATVLFAPAASANLLTNGNFETGNLSGWTNFTTTNGTLGVSNVASFNTTGGGASLGAQFGVGQVSFQSGVHLGGGIFQNINVGAAGNIDLGLDIASFAPSSFNGSGGRIALLFDGVQVDNHDFGSISGGNTERASLAASFITTAGLHELRILVTRPFTRNSSTPRQFIDNVTAIGPGAPPPPTQVPAPGSLALFGLGLAGLGFARRRKTIEPKV
jgi:hypothetical protein